MFSKDEVETFHCVLCVKESIKEDVDCFCIKCAKMYRKKASLSKTAFTKKLLDAHQVRFHGPVSLA